ncbi:proton-coupled folate transporter-like isoform X2 [Clavelina lepadiformis]|uniref:Major facilitator superfamily (MFS) profile domain-containing protein n=1 Tax=Clavelina lepadiformis TaxID=159417 RepID=A0ABP0FLA6_CLALP
MTVNNNSECSESVITVVKKQQHESHPINILRKITVEPIFLCCMVITVMYSTISSQYIYYRLSKNYGFEDETKASECGLNNVTNTTRDLQNKVTAEANEWNLYLNIANFIPSFFTTVLIGGWGDRVGRRLPLICSFTGCVLLVAIYIVVVHLELDIFYLLIGQIVYGIGGGFSGILCSCYAYLADISTHEDRTVRVAIGEANLGLGSLFGNLVGGFWIAAQGFEPLLWFLLALTLSTIFYVVVILPEAVLQSEASVMSAGQKFRSLFSCQVFVELWKFLSQNWNRTRKLLGVVFCFVLQIIIFAGVQDTIVIFVLSPPFYWSSTLIGYGSAVQDTTFVFSMIALKLLNGRLSDIWLVFMSNLSNIGGLITYALASATWIMFLGFSLTILAIMDSSVLRSTMSRLVSKHEQGAAFALVACSEATAILLGSFIFNGVYAETVGSFRGTVFLIGVGIQGVMFVVYSVVYYKTKSDLDANREKEYQSLKNEQ